MKVYALLSWYDEAPEHLERCVKSLVGFADVLVTLDGAYASFPEARAQSPVRQAWALREAAEDVGLKSRLFAPAVPWAGGEVEKRAALFDDGRRAGATSDDWFLIVDADMELASFTPDARDRLEASDLDVAEVNWHDVQIDGKHTSTVAFRSMFRALPGLTVERTHFLYTVLGDPRRFLWHTPDGHISGEPAVDLTDAVTLHHYNSQRDSDRKQQALAYYRDRDERTLESVGDWR